jgi:hypothetical protein
MTENGDLLNPLPEVDFPIGMDDAVVAFAEHVDKLAREQDLSGLDTKVLHQ